MADFSVNVQAYCKLILHAAKYPHCSVNGLLLAEKPKSKDVKHLKIVDAVPLFHQNLGLAPMMEVALTQVDSVCRSQGLVIAGYYHANQHFRDANPGHVAQRIADRVHDHFQEALLFTVDNQKMSMECEEDVYRVYHHTDGKWKQRDYKGSLDRDALPAASSLLQSRAYRDLIDFDNHLDDISLDWRNTEINRQLKHST